MVNIVPAHMNCTFMLYQQIVYFLTIELYVSVSCRSRLPAYRKISIGCSRSLKRRDIILTNAGFVVSYYFYASTSGVCVCCLASNGTNLYGMMMYGG